MGICGGDPTKILNLLSPSSRCSPNWPRLQSILADRDRPQPTATEIVIRVVQPAPPKQPLTTFQTGPRTTSGLLEAADGKFKKQWADWMREVCVPPRLSEPPRCSCDVKSCSSSISFPSSSSTPSGTNLAAEIETKITVDCPMDDGGPSGQRMVGFYQSSSQAALQGLIGSP